MPSAPPGVGAPPSYPERMFPYAPPGAGASQLKPPLTPPGVGARRSTEPIPPVHDLLVIEPSKEASEWHERDCVAWSAVPLERLERHQVPRAKPARRLDELVIVTHPRLQFDLSAVVPVRGHSGLILGLPDLNERHVLRRHYVSDFSIFVVITLGLG